MSRTVRFYKSKRYGDDSDWHRTEIDVTTKDCTNDCEPVTYRTLRKIHLIIPANHTFNIRPGSLSLRTSPGGKDPEFEIMPCHHNSHGQGRRSSNHGLTLAQQEARLLERQRLLEAELAAAEEREIRERIGVRERRPYACGGVADKDHAPPPPPPPDEASQTTKRRRVSFVEREPESSTRVNYEHYDDRHCRPRRSSQVYSEYSYQDSKPASPREEHRIQDTYPPTSYRSQNRRPSYSHRVTRSYRYHEGIPLLFQRIIMGGRRKKSHSCECARQSKHYYNANIQFETRAPENYR